tara:strand:+ start:2337 stop:2600 length:264 start_codon:yes stop_codon:yes gene_type:complete
MAPPTKINTLELIKSQPAGEKWTYYVSADLAGDQMDNKSAIPALYYKAYEAGYVHLRQRQLETTVRIEARDCHIYQYEAVRTKLEAK